MSQVRKPGRALWFVLFKIALIAAIVAIISQLDIINPATIARIFSHPSAAGLAVLLVAAAIHVSLLRWYLLLKIQGETIPLRRLWTITFTSYFIGNSLLGMAGTDALRLYYISWEKPGSMANAYLSIVVDRLMGMAGLVLVGMILLAINFAEIAGHRQIMALALYCAATIGGIVVMGALAFGCARLASPIFDHFHVVRRFTTHLSVLAEHYRSALPLAGLCLLLSVVIHLLMLGGLLTLARALFGDVLSASQFGLAGVMATLANQIPITPGGLALGEGTFAYLCHLMNRVDVTADYGSVIFLLRLVTLAATLPGLFSYLAYRRAETMKAHRTIVENAGNAR